MRLRMSVPIAAAVVLAACTTSGARVASGGERTERDLILEQEIVSRASDAANALQVIQKLRPQMLRTRGLASPTDRTGESVQPKVYIDNIEYGSLGQLQNVNASQIREIRFINSRDATTRWGTGHMGGVIHIITKR